MIGQSVCYGNVIFALSHTKSMSMFVSVSMSVSVLDFSCSRSQRQKKKDGDACSPHDRDHVISPCCAMHVNVTFRVSRVECRVSVYVPVFVSVSVSVSFARSQKPIKVETAMHVPFTTMIM